MATRIVTDIQVVGAGANFDIQPGAGFEWEVLEVGSSAWVGVPPNAVPQVNVGIFNGVIGPAWLLQAADTRGWRKTQHWQVNNVNYIRLNNPGGAGANISFVAKVGRAFGVAASYTRTQLLTVATGINWDIQPAAGFEYLINDVGSSLWIGGAPNNLPDVSVSIFDATNAAIMLRGADARGWDKNLNIYINNTNYLRLTNTNAAQAILAIVGQVAREFGTAASVVITDVQAIGAGLNWDAQPPAGREWKITEIGCSRWLGVSPAALPELTVSLFDGTNASILLQSTDSKGWLDDMEIYTDTTNYLRINDVSGVGCNACISGVLTRQFQ